MMKILHTISGMGAKDGGTSSCTYSLIKGLRNENIDAEVLCYKPLDGDRLVENDAFIHTIEFPKGNRFLYSKRFKKELQKNDSYDLYHLNGLWQYPGFITTIIARRLDKPYIVSPHGMLYPQAFKKSQILKEVIFKFFLKNDIDKAAVIHATCKEEMLYLREKGIRTPIAIIPNAIDVNALLDKPIVTNSKKRFGYLGRVHPRKKIETLLQVWSLLGNKVKDAELIIIGSGDKDYLDFLKRETIRLKLSNVTYTGFLSGSAKEAALEGLSYLAVPSDFENFGMIVVEALALGIPVIASKGTPWEELELNKCGWWIENDIKTFHKFFEIALQTSEDERLQMAQNGRLLIQQRYDSNIVAKNMVDLYKWVLYKAEKPDFVYL